ncbi:MAG TPA: peptidylprolyl isomerase [Burkholderiaceae bacterium]|nr:peptidylprolyl isomerase [Burkholderiaceae bacterium]
MQLDVRMHDAPMASIRPLRPVLGGLRRAALVCALWLPLSVCAAPRPLDRIVAVVNDEVITSVELDRRVNAAESQLKRENIPLPAADALRKQVLERLILDSAQLQLAKENGVRVDDVSVNSAIARMAEVNHLTVQELRAQVERDGEDFNAFREDMRNEIAMVRLRDHEVEARIQVSEGEIDGLLAEEKGGATEKVEYDVAQILLELPEIASPERVEAVRRRAEDLATQAKGGADFAQMAASYSNAPEALQGGDLGWRTAERLPNIFLEAIKDLKPGEVGPIIHSPVGFHVLKLVGRRTAAASKLSSGPVDQTHVRHILLRVTDAMPEGEVKRRLGDLRERVLQGGQDFGQLARLYSVDPSSTRGGDLGWLYPGDTVPEFERAMNALQVKEVSEPIKSPFGWHLIQVLERKTEQASADRNRITARQMLRDRKLEEAMQEWLRQLRDRTYVEYRTDSL